MLIAVLSCSCWAQTENSENNTAGLNNLIAQAGNGDPDAQVHLGEDYKWGHDGVAKDDAQSVRWLLKAAEQGNPRAQLDLAVAYFHGNQAVRQDYVESYMWLDLMITQQNSQALALRQIVNARARSREWVNAHPGLSGALGP